MFPAVSCSQPPVSIVSIRNSTVGFEMHLALSVVLAFFVASAVGSYNGPFPRQFIRTTTVSSTSTFTLTCTKSVANACVAGGRKRRGVLEDDDTNEQYPISPSAVYGVEPTSEPVRESRAADPQLMYVNPAYGYGYPIDSGIYNGNYRPVAIPFLEGYGQQDVAAGRIFWTRTIYSATLTVTTSTVTPACFVAGPSVQCPNA